MKILFPALKFDYGIQRRGESLEFRAFYPALMNNSQRIVPFWLEENGYPDNLDNLQKKLLESADIEKPDIIFFILMNSEIFPETLGKLKEKYITINWFCDDAWRYESFTNVMAKHFSFCVTVDKYSLNKYRKSGYNNVLLSQWAAFDYNENLDFDSSNYEYDITFVGGKNPTREWIIDELRKKNINVQCFGNGWDNGKISYEHMKKIILKSKISLNISNSVSHDVRFFNYILKKLISTIIKLPVRSPKYSLKELRAYLSSMYNYFYGSKRVETIKARNFEIPGCGGFQLSQFALEIEDYYSIGKEIAIFSNLEDLTTLITYYLENSFNREQIRYNGYIRTAQYKYDKRISEIFKQMNRLSIE